MGLQGLNFAQQFHLRIGWGPAGSLFAKVNEGERVPFPMGEQLGAQLRIRPRLQERSSLVGNFRKSVVTAGPLEPISGVSVIPFAAVDNPMEKAAIGVLDALGDRMGRVQTVVPEENKGADQVAGGGGQIGVREELFQGLIQLIMRQDPFARPGPQLRQTADCQQVPKLLKVGSDCHGSNVRRVGLTFKSFYANELASHLSIKTFTRSTGSPQHQSGVAGVSG
jgi:hypothetical protein